MKHSFEPDLYLDRTEQAQLSQIVYLPGYKVLHRLFRSEVDKFFVVLLNTDAADDHAIVAAHKMAKAAAMFYEGVTNRVNEEVIQFTNAPRANDTPIDITEAVLDLGEHVVDGGWMD